MTNKLKLAGICGALVLILAGCGEKSELKAELDTIEFEATLPAVNITDCRYLSQADDEVYKQQIAACELYNEAYRLTDGIIYKKKYEDVKKKKLFHECYDKRKSMNLEIATALNDNVRAMIYSVEDCENIGAYLKRVVDDTEDFYDYYYAYVNSDGDIGPACSILKAFYERSNILAFKFMDENSEDMIKSAVKRIVDNSYATEDLHKYISENNDLIKALNTVFGGVSQEYSELITTSEIRLVRRMLEESNNLAADDIDKLMNQLGESTPEPEASPTPKPTEEPTERPTRTPEPVKQRTPEPQRNNVPVSEPTRAPVTPAPAPVQVPVVVPTQQPVVITEPPVPTPEVYIFD
ncbi:MAG: hypothetical protein IJH37_08175 [Clostridia bacterium]|nr:hypothetical protein [Clostridia bacterium]